MKPATLILAVLTLSTAHAGSTTIALEPGYTVTDVHGNYTVTSQFWNGVALATFTGEPGNVFAVASKGNDSYIVNAYIPEPVEVRDFNAPVPPSYDGQFENLTLAIGDILSSIGNIPAPPDNSAAHAELLAEVKALRAEVREYQKGVGDMEITLQRVPSSIYIAVYLTAAAVVFLIAKDRVKLPKNQGGEKVEVVADIE